MNSIGTKSHGFACEQILYTLKISKLNYLVTETSYSVYLTIRNKFVREGMESPSATIDSNSKNEMEAENLAFKEKNADLENRLALTKVEFEEMTTRKEELLRKISKNEI